MARVILRNTVMRAGVLVRSAVEEALADLRDVGCTVKYAEKERGILSTTWYNLEITGEQKYVYAFRDWMNEMSEDD